MLHDISDELLRAAYFGGSSFLETATYSTSSASDRSPYQGYNDWQVPVFSGSGLGPGAFRSRGLRVGAL